LCKKLVGLEFHGLQVQISKFWHFLLYILLSPVQNKNSPSTPLEKLKSKIDASPGPWSKALLEKAQNYGVTELLEDLAFRRSKRMEKQRNGFKDKHCSRKGCLGCTVTPPTLSPSVIRNLGASFCNLDENNLTIPALSKNKMATILGGKSLQRRNQLTKKMLMTNRPRRNQRSDCFTFVFCLDQTHLCSVLSIFIKTFYLWVCNNFFSLKTPIV